MLIITFQTEATDILIALLYDYPFEGFQELDERVEAYIAGNDWERLRDDILEAVRGIAAVTDVSLLPEKNWNAEWEASFQPVALDDFCRIRATFHPSVPGYKHEIVIDPKMAFGTGHHETTASMIRLMQHAAIPGKRVLDLGCGTGLLGILAAKQSADDVLCVDNDPEAVANAEENAVINQVRLTVMLGTVADLPDQQFDVILANINRNVLLEIMEDLDRLLVPEGELLLSGYLNVDIPLICDAALAFGLHSRRQILSGEWAAEVFGR